MFYTLFTQIKNYLDRSLDCDQYLDPEVIPVYAGHSLFNTTKHITLLLIVQSLLHRNPPNSSIKIITIECLHRTKFFDPNHNLGSDLDNFALCKCDKLPLYCDILNGYIL